MDYSNAIEFSKTALYWVLGFLGTGGVSVAIYIFFSSIKLVKEVKGTDTKTGKALDGLFEKFAPYKDMLEVWAETNLNNPHISHENKLKLENAIKTAQENGKELVDSFMANTIETMGEIGVEVVKRVMPAGEKATDALNSFYEGNGGK